MALSRVADRGDWTAERPVLADLLNAPPIHFHAVSGGYSPAKRAVVECADGTTRFVKAAVDAHTAAALRAEHRVYLHLSADFMPRYYGFHEAELPLLVLEDLRTARWTPPWLPGDVENVLQMLDRVATAPATIEFPKLSSYRSMDRRRWAAVAENPLPFLSLGLASEAWLAKALPALIDTEASAPIEGDDLQHFDVRSDNLCLAQRGPVFDWNLACRGDRRVHVAFWLPSLHYEGGPAPWEVLPNEPGLAALVSGFFASVAGLPTIPSAPHVRTVQQAQLRTALPWVVQALGLADPV